MRPLVGLALAGVFVGILASGSAARVSNGDGAEARRTFAVSAPKVGDVTVAGLVLQAQSKKGKLKKPKLTVVTKTLPKGTTVILGMRTHPKLKRSWLVSVVAIRPKARTTSSTGSHAGLLRFVASGDVKPVQQCSETENLFTIVGDPPAFDGLLANRCGSRAASRFDFCAAYDQYRGQPKLAQSYLALIIPSQPAQKLGNGALDIVCDRPSADSFFDIFVEITAPGVPPGPPTPALSCTAPLRLFGPGEIQGTLTCNQPIGGFDFTPGGNPDVIAWLPASATCDGKTIHYRNQIPADTPFTFNVRTTPPPGPGGQLTIFNLDGNDVLTLIPTGP